MNRFFESADLVYYFVDHHVHDVRLFGTIGRINQICNSVSSKLKSKKRREIEDRVIGVDIPDSKTLVLKVEIETR